MIVETRSGCDMSLIRGEIEGSLTTGRSFFHYRDVFRYSDSDFKNKKILDVGAGNSDFARWAEKFGAKVLNLDGKYSSGFFGINEADKVTGAAQYLPFKDKAFDETITSCGILWIKTGMEQALKEMIRVTKPGGKIRISPVEKRNSYSENSSKLKKLYGLIDLGQGIPMEFIDCRETGHHYSLIINRDTSYSMNQWECVVSDLTKLLHFHKSRL